LKIGKFVTKSISNKCLGKLAHARTRIPKPENHYYDDQRLEVIVSFIEGCFHHGLDFTKILLTLNYYLPARANGMVISNHSSKDRFIFLKALAIRLMLTGKEGIEIEEILPENLLKENKKHDSSNDVRGYRECINGLLPWFLLRGRVLQGGISAFDSAFQSAKSNSKQARANRYSNYDPLPKDIVDVVSSILVLGDQRGVDICCQFLTSSGADFSPNIRLSLLRAACRCNHLQGICDDLEQTIHDLIGSITDAGPDEISERYISLSRAVAVNSTGDAGGYFDQAVEIVSKFGEELVTRWEALESLADRAAGVPNIGDEHAYRFFRCAELVGSYVSREKHWSRSNAARVAAKLSPTTALAGVSRWRDRLVGDYQYQILAILKELVSNNSMAPTIGWSVGHFLGNRMAGDLASLCIEREPTQDKKQAILDEAVRILEVEGAHQKYVSDLQVVASKFQLSNSGLSTLGQFCANGETDQPGEEQSFSSKKGIEQPDAAWDVIFKDIKIASPDGLTELLVRFQGKRGDRFGHLAVRDMLIEGLARVTRNEIYNYIDALLISDGFEFYDVKAVLCGVPAAWKIKPGLKAAWPELIKKFGRHFADDLTSRYVFDNFVADLQLSEEYSVALRNGMYEGLQRDSGLTDERAFFGFCDLSASMLSQEEAFELMDYAMRRFELHIEESFGDGPYNNNVAVDRDLNRSVAGFIWSALGSPWGWERWNAAHAVRTLAELGCTDVMNALFDFLDDSGVGSYGSADYIFYKFHAVQYFFIALARISLSHPDVLCKHSGMLKEYALGPDHLLIQKFAADAALNIVRAFPNEYDAATIDQLCKVGKSPYKARKEKYGYTTDSLWHKSKEIEVNKDFHFSYDFDHYWFEPLGRVFGVPGKQVEDIAANVVIHEWKLGDKYGYRNDPRVGLWNQSSEERETWHDHGSYPKTDNLDFYMSYHSLMVAAAKLLKAMPIVQERTWPEDVWDDWLEGHLLTIEDGRWMSDIRGSLPLNRPEWTRRQREKTWQTDIIDRDFWDRLVETSGGETWITVGGGWHEKVSERKEDVSVRSAFVASETSDPLMRALQSCEDHHDFKIPEYKEKDMEFSSGNFVLKGWLQYPPNATGLDKFDIGSADVSYPIISVGRSVMKDLNLASDFDTWKEKGMNKVVIKCENWSTNRADRDEYTDQCGMRIKADLAFLTKACKKYQRDLILEMTIDRDIVVSRMGGSNNYGKPFVKILIISGDGTIRTTEGGFGIG